MLRIVRNISLIIFGLLIVVMVGLTAAFFLVPEIEINSARLESLRARFAPKQVQVRWDDADIKLTKTGTYTKDLLFTAKNFCVELESGPMQVCFSDIRFGATLTFEKIIPKLQRLKPLVARGGEITGTLPQGEESSPSESFDDRREQILSLLKNVRDNWLTKWDFNGSEVQIKKLDLTKGKTRIRAAFYLETAGKISQSDESLAARLRLTYLEIGEATRFSGEARVLSPQGHNKNWRLVADLDGKFADGKRLGLTLRSETPDARALNFDISANGKGGFPLKRAEMHGEFVGDDLRGTVSVEVAHIHQLLESARIVGCNFEAFDLFRRGELHCGPEQIRIKVSSAGAIRGYKFSEFNPTLDITVSSLTFDHGLDAEWSVRSSLDHLGVIKFDGRVEGRFKRTVSEAGPGIVTEASGSIRLKIPEFAKLEKALRGTMFAVPAPLNDMSGPISMHVLTDMDTNRGRFPFEVTTELKSPQQKFFVTGSGVVNLRQDKGHFRPQVEAKVSIHDAQISLPRFDLRPPPRMRYDFRFQKGLSEITAAELREMQLKPLPLDFNVHIMTDKPGAARVLTNLAKAPVPLNVDMAVFSVVPRAGADSDMQTALVASKKTSKVRMIGSVRVGETPLELLKRDAKVLYFTLQNEPNGAQKIDGRVAVHLPEYDVDIFVLGNVTQPVVRFESNPPLEESQIISVLLFGKPVGELESDQQRSVAQLNNAITDAVLGFGSLYFLANSPVESIGYDTTSGMVTARLGIADKTQLTLGRGREGATEVGIHREITRNWMLNTYVENSETSDNTLVSAFVEWVKKF